MSSSKPTLYSALSLYGFVRVEECDHGIGKLIEVQGEQCEVEFFESPAGPRLSRIGFDTNRVTPVELSAETRVFCQDKLDGAWWAGRIDGGIVSAEALRKSEDHYPIRFPNGHKDLVPVSNVNVRWSHPIEDPTDYLAARITESPFFSDGRTQIVRYLSSQRASFGGLTGVASAAIELLEHQITTVRRVLADPIQRYLLADEVGLGKTIEAGVLIRQHLIDQPTSARVLVVVPAHLVPQWHEELQRKFFLHTSHTLHVISEEELVATPLSASKLTMLVVDEAHRCALHAFEIDSRKRLYYEQLCRLACLTPRVLLLSGTPVLHQEDGFLAMLHLLDPDAYPLSDREAFRRRVRDRQMIADATNDLSDDASALFVGDALERLEPLYGQDARLTELCRAVRDRETQGPADPERMRALRALRTHLTEIYRLHRRLLRTRRDDKRVRLHLPERNGLQILKYDDPSRAEAFDLIETWRLQWLAATREGVVPEMASSFSVWVEAALLHPHVLLREIDRRLTLCTELNSSWAFDGEEQFLRLRGSILVEKLRHDARTQCLIDWLKSHRDLPRVIVFVSDRKVAEKVAGNLIAAFGSKTVARLQSLLDEDGVQFQPTATTRVLVCDFDVEEGLNLQSFSATIVHYDLPLEPTRIEQRIGRVDRLEARGRLRNITLTSGEPYEAAWVSCLAEAVRVFHRSIAPLQYLLAESITRVRTQLVAEGSAAFNTEATRMLHPKIGLDAELRRIRSQEILDSLEANPEQDQAFFDALQGADENATQMGGHAMDAWMVERLKFVREPVGNEAFRYLHNTRVPTLVPVLDTLTRFAECVDRNMERRQSRTEIPLSVATFDRSFAEKAHVGLLRTGHPMVAAVEAQIRADDRGVAFAMWRYLPDFQGVPGRFLRFDFVIEPDLSHASSATASYPTSQAAIRRRAEDAFAPQYQTIWLDGDLNEVTNAQLRETLELPYLQYSNAGRRDYNVRLGRWQVIDDSFPLDDWEGLCRRARTAAERGVRASPEFVARCRASVGALSESAARLAEALQSRISRLVGSPRAAEEGAARFEALLFEGLIKGIQVPLIRADSVGAVFLANHAMPGE